MKCFTNVNLTLLLGSYLLFVFLPSRAVGSVDDAAVYVEPRADDENFFVINARFPRNNSGCGYAAITGYRFGNDNVYDSSVAIALFGFQSNGSPAANPYFGHPYFFKKEFSDSFLKDFDATASLADTPTDDGLICTYRIKIAPKDPTNVDWAENLMHQPIEKSYLLGVQHKFYWHNRTARSWFNAHRLWSRTFPPNRKAACKGSLYEKNRDTYWSGFLLMVFPPDGHEIYSMVSDEGDKISRQFGAYPGRYYKFKCWGVASDYTIDMWTAHMKGRIESSNFSDIQIHSGLREPSGAESNFLNAIWGGI